MTGIAELYLVVTRPHSKEAWTRFRAIVQRQQGFDQTRFIVPTSLDKNRFALTLRILFHHPEIAMHNELFNPIDIFIYYQKVLLRNEQGDR
jgi:hypothetical protein